MSGELVRVDEATFTYELNNTRPTELQDLSASLLAIGDQFRAFSRRQGEGLSEDDYRLYVREVRSGSIIMDLVSMATQPQMLAPLTPLLIPFAQELADWFEFLKGVKDAKDIKELILGSSKKDLQQISQIVEPAAKDPGSSIQINATHGGIVVVGGRITSLEANAGQNILRRYIDNVALAITGIHRDQVLYWYQMRDDRAAKPGDKGVIERLWKNPVKVRITSDDIKREMIDKQDNPFRKFYVVDVDVTEVQGRPVLYRILEVKDTFDRDEPAE